MLLKPKHTFGQGFEYGLAIDNSGAFARVIALRKDSAGAWHRIDMADHAPVFAEIEVLGGIDAVMRLLTADGTHPCAYAAAASLRRALDDGGLSIPGIMGMIA
jgi:hypothetical protein